MARKQLTIFCSRDLDDRVVSALDRAGLEGFLRIGGATGNKFVADEDLPRSMSWEASVFMVPEASGEQADRVLDELEEYANACETRPCLRMVVAGVERVF